VLDGIAKSTASAPLPAPRASSSGQAAGPGSPSPRVAGSQQQPNQYQAAACVHQCPSVSLHENSACAPTQWQGGPDYRQHAHTEEPHNHRGRSHVDATASGNEQVRPLPVCLCAAASSMPDECALLVLPVLLRRLCWAGPGSTSPTEKISAAHHMPADSLRRWCMQTCGNLPHASYACTHIRHRPWRNSGPQVCIPSSLMCPSESAN
jgi:hypothetical protein